MLHTERISYLVVAVLLCEEEEAGADLLRMPGQGGTWSMGSAAPGRLVIKAAQLIIADLSRCGYGEHISVLNLVQMDYTHPPL